MLVGRPLEERDLEACANLLRGLSAYPDPHRATLPVRWRALLGAEALIGHVVEERAGEGATRIVGFGCAVFVGGRWLADALEDPRPGLALRTLDADAAGGAGPILHPPAIGRADAAGGLELLILHYAEAELPSREARMDLRYRMMMAFVDTFRGYRLSCVVQELCDEIPHEFIVNGWGTVHSDHGAWFARSGEQPPPPGRRPYLVRLTRDEALASPGNPMAALFVQATPRFGLSRAEKAMLRHALQGRTDRELAGLGGVTLPTVKSRWRNVYGRIGRIDPGLLPEGAGVGAGGARGREKRRRLLEYLRQHPEELRLGIDERRRGAADRTGPGA